MMRRFYLIITFMKSALALMNTHTAQQAEFPVTTVFNCNKPFIGNTFILKLGITLLFDDLKCYYDQRFTP